MTELLNLQEQFQKFLLSGQSNIVDSIIQTELVSADTRLGIYRDAYRLRLIECLSSNFPALHTYLGTEQFNELATLYINAHPSSYRSIRWYGDLLPDFIKSQYPQYPNLAELADFEWKMSLAFDAVDAHVVRVEDMASVAPEAWGGLQFILHPSLQRINYVCNSIPLWQALTHEQKLPELQQSSEPTAWVLWRKPEYLIQFYSLSCEEAWALDNLLQGISFGTLCEGLCHWINPEEVGMQAASYLKGWIQNGMISQLLLPE
ncbi:DUF2063 domain-containing protein [Legionella longbeachae]|uniref:Putative DNA-binding domain-containing protein n=1 Tax=Legionella longbeachae serogroup 1 (strain NSW150) TaxID=661367 RepID=D3HQD0_LEGLN|nr:putative DNA-binding domain-containing protein [Legionella longbeachae]VEE01615.1 Uncharacterized protein conserved in bacteria [Legionella oakridgensis]HBD7396375.1 putative DNA-binding domain-containing protein [Legionella pneumophila]ARB92043.1 DUF2063 domain-containing protein [Legionella longbeachae]ARM34773.1 DUF2063 domain-containing protein [Legionella longbeachae]EEZ95794.1 conserved hypothetical protein [Legionella longbeachae D-4968]